MVTPRSTISCELAYLPQIFCWLPACVESYTNSPEVQKRISASRKDISGSKSWLERHDVRRVNAVMDQSEPVLDVVYHRLAATTTDIAWISVLDRIAPRPGTSRSALADAHCLASHLCTAHARLGLGQAAISSRYRGIISNDNIDKLSEQESVGFYVLPTHNKSPGACCMNTNPCGALQMSMQHFAPTKWLPTDITIDIFIHQIHGSKNKKTKTNKQQHGTESSVTCTQHTKGKCDKRNNINNNNSQTISNAP